MCVPALSPCHATGASRLMRPIFNKLEMSPRCQVSQSPTGKIDPQQKLLNLYENVRFDSSKFCVSCSADECDWVIQACCIFRKVLVLYLNAVWSAGVITDLIRFVLSWWAVSLWRVFNVLYYCVIWLIWDPLFTSLAHNHINVMLLILWHLS